MKMVEISKEKFDNFAKKNSYYNYYQTANYGLVMAEHGFEYSFIAYTTNENEILAAGMFLTKKIGTSYYYAYSPKGFIIDYSDTELLRKFTNNLKKFYRRKKVILLKINPEIPIATLDSNNNFERTENANASILEDLKSFGFKKRKESEPLQLLEPKLTGIINLKDYSVEKLNKETQLKIENTVNKGLEIEVTDATKVEVFYEYIKNKTEKNINYFRNLLINFKKDNQADLLLVKVNYEKYLISAKKKVEEEQVRNDELNERLQKDASEKNLTEKMESDKLLEEYKQNVVYATAGLRKNEETYIGGAIVVKFENKITIVELGIDETHEYLHQNYFLYDRIFDMYKDEYEIADINAIANDFSDSSVYNEFNKIKLGFNPIITEYIGELDLIISEWRFKIAEKNNLLSSEFIRKTDSFE